VVCGRNNRQIEDTVDSDFICIEFFQKGGMMRSHFFCESLEFLPGKVRH